MKLAFSLTLSLALATPLLAAPTDIPPGVTAPPDKTPNTPPTPPLNANQDNPAPPHTAPTKDDTSIHDAPINLQDLIRVLNVRMWKWQFRLPPTTEHVFFIREEWHKGDKAPALTKQWDFMLNPAVPPLAGDLHTVVVRWPNRENPYLTTLFDDNGGAVGTSQDEPYYDRSYGIQVNSGNNPDQTAIKLNEPLTLVQTTYKNNNIYGIDDYRPGIEQTNERTVYLKIVASDFAVKTIRWDNGKILLAK